MGFPRAAMNGYEGIVVVAELSDQISLSSNKTWKQLDKCPATLK